MTTSKLQVISQFGGIKNDNDPKLIEPKYLSSITNWNFPDDGTLGFTTIKMPSVVKHLYTATSTLSGDITNSATTIAVVLATTSIDIGMITIGSEQIRYAYIATNTYYGCTRGVNGTSAAAHLSGATVYQGFVVSDGNLGTTASPTTDIFNYCTGTKNIDGIKEYDFIDINGVNHSYIAVVSESILFLFNKDWTPVNVFGDSFHAPKFNYVPLRITAGKVSMQVYGQDLYIANGIDYPVVFHGTLYNFFSPYANENQFIYLTANMGAPVHKASIVGNQLATTYKYKMSFVSAGGEEILGGEAVVSSYNTGGSQGYSLYTPLGYSGTTSRKLYRTKQGNLSNFFLVDTIADNTTLTYNDTKADAALGAAMSTTVNNALPKISYLCTANGCLYGAKNSLHPTQVYRTETGIQVFDAANYIEISDQGNDNTPVEGVGVDFSAILIWTAKNTYLLTPNTTDATLTDVILTRAFCGIKNGFTAKSASSFGDFPGGVMFVSSNNEIRIMTGLQALPVATSVDNIRTMNYGQNIRGDLIQILPNYTNIYAEYYDNKYYLLIDGILYVFDTRAQSWTKHYIRTTNHTFTPLILSVLNIGTSDIPNYQLFSGNANGEIEQYYVNADGTYRGEAVNNMKLISGYINASADYKRYEKIRFWFKTTTEAGASITVRITLDDNLSSAKTETFTFTSPPFNADYYNYDYFATERPLDFEIVNIDDDARWLKYSITCNSGNISLQRVEFIGEPLRNQEV